MRSYSKRVARPQVNPNNRIELKQRKRLADFNKQLLRFRRDHPENPIYPEELTMEELDNKYPESRTFSMHDQLENLKAAMAYAMKVNGQIYTPKWM